MKDNRKTRVLMAKGIEEYLYPIVNTFAGTLPISSHDAYSLIDTGVTHSCMSEDFMHVCGLIPEVIADLVMSVSTPWGPRSL